MRGFGFEYSTRSGHNWKDDLSSWLVGGKKVLVCGVGLIECGDDAAGLKVVRLASCEMIGRADRLVLWFESFDRLERSIRFIEAASPDRIIFVDATSSGAPPGSVRLFDFSTNPEKVFFSTHRIPFFLVAEYLRRVASAETVLIGIEGASYEVNARMTPPVEAACEEVATGLRGLFHGWTHLSLDKCLKKSGRPGS